MLEVGKLYRCEEKVFYLYPDKLAAYTSSTTPTWQLTDFWTEQIAKHDHQFINKNCAFLVLEVDKEYVHVLSEGKVGWIRAADWLEIEEVV